MERLEGSSKELEYKSQQMESYKIEGGGEGKAFFPLIKPSGEGFCRSFFKFKNLGENGRSNSLGREALNMIGCVLTRAVDFAIAPLAVTLVSLTFGQVESLNNLAFRTMQSPLVIQDVLKSIEVIVNSRAQK